MTAIGVDESANLHADAFDLLRFAGQDTTA
jgi:hypothetical protein